MRAPEPVPVCESDRRRQLAEYTQDLLHPVLAVMDLLGIRVKRGHRCHRTDENAHRVGVRAEGREQILQTPVDLRFRHHAVVPVRQLAGRRQFAEKQQVRHLQKGAFLRQLFDRVTPVTKYASVAVDKGDAALAGRRICIAGIVHHHAKVIGLHLELAQADGRNSIIFDRQINRLAGAIIGDS